MYVDCRYLSGMFLILNRGVLPVVTYVDKVVEKPVVEYVDKPVVVEKVVERVSLLFFISYQRLS